MKKIHHPRAAGALVLAAALCAFTPGLAAQSSGNAQPGDQQQAQQQSKTFTGKVLKLEGGQFALVTGQTPEGKLAGHFLDNADQAKNYEGKQVTVTGTLDVASNTIHVTNIQAA
ncbi:MAG TPA: hypothetical protein VL991_00935 [Terracidiphilus sp.]|jgi:hypothetical protein|nr:hypothetical protein [Terracidiphilus sp.]